MRTDIKRIKLLFKTKQN
jgi:hypothetical protein